MKKMGRNPIQDRNKIVRSVPCNCYLSNEEIEKLGGDKVVRQLFQQAGYKEIENLLFLKSKVQ
jgi:hypothetical protein